MPQSLMPLGTPGRRPKALPRLHDHKGNPLPRYESEKRLGIRRENGALKLKRLTNRHMRIIGMHISGLAGEVIAHTMGCTVATISRILNDPLSQEIISRSYKDRQKEIDALAGKAIDVVRETLSDANASRRERLMAVDKFAKLKDTIGHEDSGRQSAEDVIAKMLDRIGHIENLQINIGDV
jgi:hypothetical protein